MGNRIGKEGYNAGREAVEIPGVDEGFWQIMDLDSRVAAVSFSPPETPGRFRSPFTFSSQSSLVDPLKSDDDDIPEQAFSNLHLNDPSTAENLHLLKGIPTLITWSHGGSDVSVEGSWDNWSSRKPLQICGNDHSIFLVLPCGVYHYKYLVDGEWKHTPDLPCFVDDKGGYINVLDVQSLVDPLKSDDDDIPEQAFSNLHLNNPNTAENLHLVRGIPTLITWSYGGSNVSVEGSWDNWASRKPLQICGKDHSVFLVLPCGVYHYKYLVDGEWKHTPDLPCFVDDKGDYINVLDVQDFVPDNLDSVSEFELPMSPDSSYGCLPFGEEDFAEELPEVPPHLDLVDEPGPPDAAAADSAGKPRYVVLNHLFVEKGWGSRSVVALGTTERFRSK